MTSLSRRNFIYQAGSAGLMLPHTIGNDSAGASEPIRTIYSNDTTHMISCLRPEQRPDEFSDDLLVKSITEAAGVDAHFLQPGLGWIPWWQSKVYSIDEHYRWLQDSYGIKGVTKFDRYILNGGDLLQVLVDTCREIDVAPFLSFRINDGHHVRGLDEALKRNRPSQKMSRFYWDNYRRFRIGADTTEWEQGVFDWRFPEVRDHKFALIEEACANYDLAGLELDFLRHWNRFGPDTSPDERLEITTSFVRQIRTMLDRTATQRNLPRRQLCVRVPAKADVRPQQGIDLARLADAGVDMFNLSYSYFTWQDDSVRTARKQLGDRAAIYAEMTHCTLTGKATAGSGTQPFQRTTDDQFYTTALMTYQQGGTGVSLFNFPYYRYHVTDTIGPFHEPPFHVIASLGDPSLLEKKSRSLFLSAGRNDPVLGEKPLPAILKRPHSQSFQLHAPEAQTGQGRHPGVLRLRSDEPIADRTIEVHLNGHLLDPVDTETMLREHRYKDTWTGLPEEFACFEVPKNIDITTTNKITITVRKGIRVRLIFLDVVSPV